MSNKIRKFTCRHIFKKKGRVSTIQKGVYIGTGARLEIGDYSGIGKNALIPENTIIGNYVLIAQNLIVIANNHVFEITDIPMGRQGCTEHQQTVIGDDVWIGANVIILPGKRIGRGCIIGAGSVLTNDTGEYEIWGGNPAKRIKSRLKDEK